jgi:hypothetical protein
MATIYLVSCVSKKKNATLPAKTLYDSEWFRKARSYVESTGKTWYILSAKYGLIEPDSLIEPYNQTLNLMPKDERVRWSNRVLSELKARITRNDTVIILAGSKYQEYLLDGLRNICARVEIPMQNLRIGEQLSWLSRN